MRKNWLLFIILCLSILLTQNSYAQLDAQASAETIYLDGVGYSTDQLVWDFLNISINRSLWLDDSEQPEEIVGIFRKNQDLSQLNVEEGRGPSLSATSEFRLRKEGLPKAFTINKWVKPPSIGFGLPSIVYQTSSPSDAKLHSIPGFGTSQGDYSSLYHEIMDHLAIGLPQIEKIIGFPIETINPNDQRETLNIGVDGDGEKFASIRIVLTQDIRGRGSESFIDHTFVTGVPFTNRDSASVQGYYLQDKGGNIHLSICRIDARWPQSLIETQAMECILRSLGLPALSVLNEHTLLGRWNGAVANYNKDYFSAVKIEQENFLKEKYGDAPIPQDISQQGFMQDFLRSQPKYEFPVHLVDAKVLKDGVTEYDRFMLSLLYCKAVKPNMDSYKVLAALIKGNNNCIDRALENLND